MARIRPTRKIGNSDYIKLEQIDKQDLNIEIGVDDVDLSDIIIIKKRNKK